MSRNRPNKTIMVRIIIVMCLFGVVAFIPLIAKLINIQLVDYKMYQAKAIEQQTRDTIITPKRGVIYDRNMNELAVSATAETVYIAPVDIKTADEEALIARILSETLDLDYNAVLEKTKNKKSYYQVIKKKVDRDVATQLRQQIKDNNIKAIHLAEDTKRYYPLENFASQVIGFCGDENTGLMGIEAIYEDSLKGMPGRIIAAKNARGTEMPFKYEEYFDAQNGQNVVLTIDENIQQILEKHLGTAVIDAKAQQRGAGIVLDVKTGEVLAMATMGDFNLNEPFTLTDPDALARIAALPEDQQKQARSDELNAAWRNKFISDSYEPGSVFKILTIAMALEEGVVTPQSTFHCSGVTRVGDRNIHCWKKGGHGTVNLSQALEKSCNCALMEIGSRVGNQKFYDYVTAFGLREKTGIDLPGEANGYFFKESEFTNPKNKVSLAVASFGQTFKVTPMQMICAVSAVVNDGKLMKPHMVKEIVDANGAVVEKHEPETVRQIISKETSDFLCGAMEEVVATGTGKNAYVKGYRVGGKTGTSEKVDEYVEGQREKYIASFLGVAPMDDPQYAILILIDDPTGMYYEGSQVAAPVAGKVFSEMLPYMGLEPVYTEDEKATADIIMPQLIGSKAGDAKTLLKSKRYAELTVRTVGDGDTVTDQIPAYSVKIPANSEVVLYLGGKAEADMVTVPNVVGMTPEEANRALMKVGLYLNATGAVSKGSGSVTASKQQYAKDSKVARGTVVTVEFYATQGVEEGVTGRM